MADRGTIFGRRRAGLLAHITSLPGDGARGSIGAEARHFVDFLAGAGFTVWQTLPLGPVNASSSPYQSTSAFAGNAALLPPVNRAPEDGYAAFREAQAYWLEDYVLYAALQAEQGGQAWYQWPRALRDREPGAMDEARRRLAGPIDALRREQHAFFDAWDALKDYAHGTGVYLFGDLPMFPAHDSADVWSRRELFCVNGEGRMLEMAGAPPDGYAPEGQDWGCPQYRWEVLAASGFRWWIERLRTQMTLFDILRLDHFRGFEASWRIPAGGSPASGRWEPVPGEALFAAVQDALGPLPLVAEDLGHITPAVHALRRKLGLPGMHVLQFAFEGGADNPHLPHNHEAGGVVYTGTHDNDTTLGWWQSLHAAAQGRVREYLDFGEDPMPWPLVHAALASVCVLAVLPLQDCLGLDGRARMNTPGTTGGNWYWRCPAGALDGALEARLLTLVQLYARDG
jgi:4-alpha-glucanotransferase